MYISEAISANAIASSILICVLLNARGKMRFGNRAYKWMTQMIIYNLLLCVGETFSVIIDGQHFTGVVPHAMALNSVLYLLNIGFAEKWLEFNFIRLFGDQIFKRKKILRILLPLPMLLATVLVVVNLFYPILFSIDPETMLYERQPLFTVIASLTYGYLAGGISLFLFYRKKLQRYMLGSVIFFILPVISASVLQMIFVGISIMWAGSAIGILSMYLYMQDESALIDELSGVYSRSYLINYIEVKCAKAAKKGACFVGIMLDVDSFKRINDEHGHQAGDEVIFNIGRVLRASVPVSVGFAARYGGDEFVIIAMTSNKDEVNAVQADIQANLDIFNKSSKLPFTLNVSLGHTLYQKDDTPESFILRMDTEMYKDKQKHKNLN